jgi:hypothetical protein
MAKARMRLPARRAPRHSTIITGVVDVYRSR